MSCRGVKLIAAVAFVAISPSLQPELAAAFQRLVVHLIDEVIIGGSADAAPIDAPLVPAAPGTPTPGAARAEPPRAPADVSTTSIPVEEQNGAVHCPVTATDGTTRPNSPAIPIVSAHGMGRAQHVGFAICQSTATGELWYHGIEHRPDGVHTTLQAAVRAADSGTYIAGNGTWVVDCRQQLLVIDGGAIEHHIPDQC